MEEDRDLEEAAAGADRRGPRIAAVLKFHNAGVWNTISYSTAYALHPQASFESLRSLDTSIDRLKQDPPLRTYAARGWIMHRAGDSMLREERSARAEVGSSMSISHFWGVVFDLTGWNLPENTLPVTFDRRSSTASLVSQRAPAVDARAVACSRRSLKTLGISQITARMFPRAQLNTASSLTNPSPSPNPLVSTPPVAASPAATMSQARNITRFYHNRGFIDWDDCMYCLRHTVVSHKDDKTCCWCLPPSVLTTRRCGRCKRAKYCSKACQEADWKVHKPLCALLRAVPKDEPATPDIEQAYALDDWAERRAHTIAAAGASALHFAAREVAGHHVFVVRLDVRMRLLPRSKVTFEYFHSVRDARCVPAADLHGILRALLDGPREQFNPDADDDKTAIARHEKRLAQQSGMVSALIIDMGLKYPSNFISVRFPAPGEGKLREDWLARFKRTAGTDDLATSLWTRGRLEDVLPGVLAAARAAGALRP
ncbi:hypothetical protein BV25DRAFT_1920076 [Artomyces pyxidatus]|uniref:Uncharacterized protein n=1 Tax=Artomyces pyxidatus TaxID=48021 RepID=A0ACB8SMB8_9AGAM|nr:hypothetical protein BV25DRAFT_1920076 [Artomyces pyxidatus]